jgi:hypothetical protein
VDGTGYLYILKVLSMLKVNAFISEREHTHARVCVCVCVGGGDLHTQEVRDQTQTPLNETLVSHPESIWSLCSTSLHNTGLYPPDYTVLYIRMIAIISNFLMSTSNAIQNVTLPSLVDVPVFQRNILSPSPGQNKMQIKQHTICSTFL